MKPPEQQSECPYCGTPVNDLICDKPPIMSKQIFENRERLVSEYVKASAAELVEKAELKAWISARDLQDFKDYQDEARNSSFSISTFKTLNDDVQITINASSAKAREWIPVGEPPTETDNYLASRFAGDSGYPLSYSVEYNGWNIGLDGDRENELFPSHWMPLPEPPKVESEVGK